MGRRFSVGTRSVLYGAHAFWLHPWFVAAAWWKLYGFPWDPRLWVAFFVHDLGYWGKPNMDGPEGETHPFLGAAIMTRLFDGPPSYHGRLAGGEHFDGWVVAFDPHTEWDMAIGPWGRFVCFHSRFLAKANRHRPTRLCVADKLAVTLEPWWLYLPRVVATGEIREYMALAAARENGGGKYSGERASALIELFTASRRAWFAGVTRYLRLWVAEHRDGRDDTWTPGARIARDDLGVWS